MVFELDNYSVLVAPADFFANNDPASDTIATANLPDFKTIGVVESGSSYKIEPNQKARTSLGDEIIYSHKLSVELKVMAFISKERLAEIDGKIFSIVLAPKNIVIPETASDLSDANVVIPNGATVLMFKGDLVKVIEDVKMGTLEVNPVTLSVETIAPTKSELKKEFGFTLS